MRSQKSINRKAAKARARRRDFVWRRNINTNVPMEAYTEKRELYQRIRNSAVKERIHLIGFVEELDKPAVYNLASVFVYPSLYEGFGFPPLEAMACGVPVVVSHSSSLPELVGDAGILIDPYRPSEILDAFEALLGKDTELPTLLSKRGQERSVRYSWAQTSQKLKALFESL